MKKINLPTKLTLLRIVIAFVIVFLLAFFYILDELGIYIQAQNYFEILNIRINYIYLIVLFLFAIASFTDFLDGHIARKYNLITDLGKFLDPLADKMLINSLFIFLAINFKSFDENIYFVIPWFCVVLMIIRDLAVDGMRFIAAKNNVVVAANYWGKAKTVLQMVTIIIVLLNGFPFSCIDKNWPQFLKISDLLCYITTLVSLIGGVIYLIENKKVFKN